MNKKLFLIKVRKNETRDDIVLPRHPEYVMVAKLSDTKWQAEDTESGEVITINKSQQGDFYLFEVEQESASC